MLSYSSVLPNDKVTLPSVEMWGTNMNIIKDPPRGIFTRRKDRVGDTQQILMQQDDAGSRANEFISVYARNTNPMVGVSYNNYGNSQGGGRRAQASLPYKVDVVRPPIMSPYDLQPLSRLPRDWFYASTNPEFPTVVQNLQCNGVGKNIENFNLRSNLDVTANKSMLNSSISDNTHGINTSSTAERTLLNFDVDTNKSATHMSINGQLPKDLRSIKQKSLLSQNVSSSKQGTANPNISSRLKKLMLKKKPDRKMDFQSNLVAPNISSGVSTLGNAHVSYPLSNKLQVLDVQTTKTLSRPKRHLPNITLEPNIPHYSVKSNQSSSSVKDTLKHEYFRELGRKMPMAEDVQTTKMLNIEKLDAGLPNRNRQIQERLSTFGGFDNPGNFMPNPSGIPDKQISTQKVIDKSKREIRQKMQEYFRV